MLKHSLLVFTILSGADFLFASAVAQPLQKPDPLKAPPRVTLSDSTVRLGAESLGKGTAVFADAAGARLHCLFQRLDGEATAQGLWLTSMVTNTVIDRFRVRSVGIGVQSFPDTGTVSIVGQTVRWSRPGLTEEYSVSLDGVRQDFIVERAPGSIPVIQQDQLVLTLSLEGARAEPAGDGLRLVLNNSARRIAYSRLRATDATGKELPARIEVCAGQRAPSFRTSQHSTLAIRVDDAHAIYPIRIDPTFSDANWLSMGGLPGADGSINAAVVDGFGNLYVGGQFTVIGSVTATNVARWDGSNWSPLGAGIGFYYWESVRALAISGSTLYAGGDFMMAGSVRAENIAQWDGSTWSAIGPGLNGTPVPGVNGTVSALAVSGGTLYVGGEFTVAGTNAVNSIAQWDGTHWSALASGVSGPQFGAVYALAVSGGNLFAAGYFTSAGGVAATNIARWDGNSWSPLGSGLNYLVLAIAVSGNTLYAGGEFDHAGPIPVNYVAQWNGTNWSPLGSGVSASSSYPYVYALAVSSSMLYAGGSFTTAGGISANHIAKWDGSNWSTLDSGMPNRSDDVAALAILGNTLYAGGSFSSAGGVTADSIAQWNGTDWSALGSGLNGTVDAMVVSDGTLYVGGTFTTAATNAVNHLAQWTGSGWSALATGLEGQVNTLAASGTTLYAGGAFTMAGTNLVNHIAQWTGTNWLPLGSGVSGAVNALAASGGTLYAGGSFTNAGSVFASNIAQWDGTSWTSLGSGMNGSVQSLAVYGGTLYAGGAFTTAGGNPANSIARWDGTNWSALGNGMNGDVTTLAMSGGMLYAGGAFTMADYLPVYYLAQWDGSHWAALGSNAWFGVSGYVAALVVSGGTLYVGGLFTYAAGRPANYLAQWDGTNWSAIGSGANGPVYAMAASDNRLYVGGSFLVAGGKVSAYCAELNLLPIVLLQSSGAGFGFTNGTFGFNVYGPPGSNVVIQGSSDLLGWVPLQTNALGNGLLHYSDPIAVPHRFYRALLLP